MHCSHVFLLPRLVHSFDTFVAELPSTQNTLLASHAHLLVNAKQECCLLSLERSWRVLSYVLQNIHESVCMNRESEALNFGSSKKKAKKLFGPDPQKKLCNQVAPWATKLFKFCRKLWLRRLSFTLPNPLKNVPWMNCGLPSEIKYPSSLLRQLPLQKPTNVPCISRIIHDAWREQPNAAVKPG